VTVRRSLFTPRRIFTALAILLAGILLYLALRQVSWSELWQAFQAIRLEYVGLAFFTTTLALAARALRWGVLVSAQKRTSLLSMFWATAAGYMGNNFLPARAGELIRSIMLGKDAGISASFVLATALTERLMDVIALVMIGAWVISTIALALPSWLYSAIQWMALVGLLALAIFLLAPRLEKWLLKILGFLRLPEKWQTRLSGLLSQFLSGAKALVHPGRAAAFITLTIVVWAIDGAGNVIFAHGMGLSLGFEQALLLLVALGLSSALPSTPGFVGIYQFVAVTVLPAFGWSPSQALAYILAGQAINVVTISLWGLIGMARAGIKLKSL
jgi:uncharacterized protein (TIRG00374 family)